MVAAKRAVYPSLTIALISITPRPAASATADPDMPAKIMLPITLTCARPPRIRPTRRLATANIRSVVPPTFIRLPARMKNGIASRGKEVVAA